MIAENNPNVLNRPIEEVAIIANPATSETAEPTKQAHMLHQHHVMLGDGSALSLSLRDTVQ